MAQLKQTLFTLIWLSLSHFSFSQNQLLKNFLTVEEGLSHNEVTSIVQDNDGFMWIGTRGGLNRYDGYEFKIYNQVPGDSNSLVNPSIESLFVDRDGNIWIATKSGGISKFNPNKNQFTNIVSDYLHESQILSDNRILSFFQDKEGKIWIGTWSHGFLIYDEATGTSKNYLEGEQVNSIFQSSDGRIWIGTGSMGLLEFDLNSEKIAPRTGGSGSVQQIVEDKKRNVLWITADSLFRYDLRNDSYKTYPINGYSLILDSNNDLWIGTWGRGLYLFSPEQEQFQRLAIYPDILVNRNKDYDAILYIFRDRDENIWLGTNGGGLCILTPKLAFQSIGYHPAKNKGLFNTRVMSVVDDSRNNLWIGTIGSGLIWSPDRQNFYPVPCEKNTRRDFFVIKYLFEDNEHRIWAGTNSGTYFVEFADGHPEMIKVQDVFEDFPNVGAGVSFLDFDDQFWYGTLDHGLFVLDKINNYRIVKHFSFDNTQDGLMSDRISFQLRDSKNRIWLGTYNGLHVYNPIDSTIHVASRYFDISGSFTGNIITCIDEDQYGNLWIGTPNGLNKLSETGANKFKVEYFTEKNGLASNFVKGIAHDANGNIWVSTSTSISMFDVQQATFVNFNERDGIRGKNFTEASVFRNRNGELFFGGDYSLTYFLPEEIEPPQKSSKPIFTDLRVFNKHVEIGERFGSKVLLRKTITHTSEINIPYSYNNVEIQFSALDYKSMGEDAYMYMLEGLDKEWQYLGKRRFVSFINLKPGEYALKVKTANNHSTWNNEVASITIHILPPFWQTWYALVFYILVIIGIVTFIRWNAIRQVRLANSLEMEKFQHEQDQKISEVKFQFFTNISHEFRTPLTLILAPLKEILKKDNADKIPDEILARLQIVQKNTARLMKLVNQLLEFRKAEVSNVKLAARNSDIEAFVREIAHPFAELAKINEIEFSVHSAISNRLLWFDIDKMEIILNNLISNAFKFTRAKGKVEISLYEEEDEILISVSDNGPGIPASEINYIFDRFYRIERGDNYGSSGIGLSLVKRFVELHGGSISVSSEPNENTEFVVSIPKGREHLKPDEIITSESLNQSLLQTETPIFGILAPKNTLPGDAAMVLVVDDDQEVNRYLSQLLGKIYRVETAFDGSEGFQKASELKPDLVISDVMMAGMDGFELCKKIKSNKELSTIPIVLLTAKNAGNIKLLSVQTGADEFITKPFDPDYLVEKIKNLLLTRKKLQEQYSKSVRLEPSDVEITSSEEALIEKAIRIIEKNLQEQSFTSDSLAAGLNLSNSSLYRKLKALTGLSTAEFIRSIRIKRAAQLLADKEKTVSEIAFDVGFNDVKHFRTVFQKQFGCAPTEYRERV